MFYNCSNVNYRISDVIYGEALSNRHNLNVWNVRYENSHRKFNSLLEDDKIAIEAFIDEVPDFSLQGTTTIKSIHPLVLQIEKDREIVLPNNPSNIKKFGIDDSTGPIMHGRVKVLCDDAQVAKCFYENNKLVVLAPSNTGSTTLRIVDQLVVGSPEIDIPVNIMPVS